jgi:hypothetical protein
MESLCVDVARTIRVPIFIRTLSLQYFPLPKEDYLLGLSDLTGELMRFAISGFSRKGGRGRAMQVCKFVRDCKSGMSSSPAHTTLDSPVIKTLTDSRLSSRGSVRNRSLLTSR